MKFCNICSSIVSKNVSSGVVKFTCVCGNEFLGGDDDTLIVSETLEISESLATYKDMINNSPQDAASYKVEKTCPKCKLNYMNLLRLGSAHLVILTCSCGYQTTAF